MAQTQIADVVVPAEFTAYQVENSLVSTALFQSGVLVENGLIAARLANGSNNFNIPFWSDLGETDPDITSDDPTVLSTALSGDPLLPSIFSWFSRAVLKVLTVVCRK